MNEKSDIFNNIGQTPLFVSTLVSIFLGCLVTIAWFVVFILPLRMAELLSKEELQFVAISLISIASIIFFLEDKFFQDDYNVCTTEEDAQINEKLE